MTLSHIISLNCNKALVETNLFKSLTFEFLIEWISIRYISINPHDKNSLKLLLYQYASTLKKDATKPASKALVEQLNNQQLFFWVFFEENEIHIHTSRDYDHEKNETKLKI